jgi:diacylglycerol kinase (ATP)
LEGVIVLNIPSYGGGSDLWRDSASLARNNSSHELVMGEETPAEDSDSETDGTCGWRRSSVQDKVLEVVGVTSSAQLGAAHVGLCGAMRLAQGNRIRLRNSANIAAQVDGEPFMLGGEKEITIEFQNQALMLMRSWDRTDAVAAEVLDLALERELITAHQRNELVKEIARRVTTKRRIG